MSNLRGTSRVSDPSTTTMYIKITYKIAFKRIKGFWLKKGREKRDIRYVCLHNTTRPAGLDLHSPLSTSHNTPTKSHTPCLRLFSSRPSLWSTQLFQQAHSHHHEVPNNSYHHFRFQQNLYDILCNGVLEEERGRRRMRRGLGLWGLVRMGVGR